MISTYEVNIDRNVLLPKRWTQKM